LAARLTPQRFLRSKQEYPFAAHERADAVGSIVSKLWLTPALV